MDFASSYLANKTLINKLFADIPEKNTGIIITIPAFNEPGIIFTLNSLLKCKITPCNVEIIVLVNAPRNAELSQIQQNRITCDELTAWQQENKDGFLTLLFHDAGKQDDRGWGVGMARKMAMDEALRRFSSINNPEGVIVSLDADCLVSENYLEELYDHLYERSDRKACSVYFEHPLTGNMPPDIYVAITLYELHLRYYYQALKYTGFPWAFQTIGSALAVKADAYTRAGGMNRRQGAEDFYFIQKLVTAGGYFYLNSAAVMPSPRISDRVPFGTGPVIAKMISNNNDVYLTYDPAGFEYLKNLFDNVLIFFDTDYKTSDNIYNSLHLSLKEFLDDNNWLKKIPEIRNNTASKESFRKRFFNWFNMFKIVKYLNFLHSGRFLIKIPVQKAAVQLLYKMGVTGVTDDANGLLKLYKEMER